MIWIICSFTEIMIISYALQQFLFCGSEVHDRDRGAVCPGDRDRSRHVVCHGADGIDDGCTKRTCPWIWEGVSRTWDLMRGRYGGIRGSALGGNALLFYWK